MNIRPMVTRFNLIKYYRLSVLTITCLVLLIGCTNLATPQSRIPIQTTSPAVPTTDTAVAAQLTPEQYATLNSLEIVDEHPLYTMHYMGAYNSSSAAAPYQENYQTWACSLFATLTESGPMIYGRNFDWQYSPAVLLFTDPPDGYASVSMVDIAYLGFEGDDAKHLLDLPITDRQDLLAAPSLPFDGMNEHGLVVGMAAVPPGNAPPDPAKPTIGSLGIIRQLLDHARTVEEAISIFDVYNIDFSGGPAIHYLVADRSGKAALVEYYLGERMVTYNDRSWHLATNFLRCSVSGEPNGHCWRYDLIAQRLDELDGQLSAVSGMNLLSDVAQTNTQWSVVYDFGAGDILIAMNKAYDDIHPFRLTLANP